MNSSQQFVKCPECGDLIRRDRLNSHIKKVHHSQKIDVNSNNSVEVFAKNAEPLEKEKLRQIDQATEPLKKKKIRQVEILVNSWLRRKRDYLHNSNNVRILTIMVLENFMKYSFIEINKLHNFKICKDRYQTGAKRLKIIYQKMMDDLYKHLDRYKQNYNEEESYFENDEPDDCVDWYIFNSIDRMDGSRYIGYHRREYKDRRFGSMPMYDNYSEESWPDHSPFE